jgi:hypothetical protein
MTVVWPGSLMTVGTILVTVAGAGRWRVSPATVSPIAETVSPAMSSGLIASSAITAASPA